MTSDARQTQQPELDRLRLAAIVESTDDGIVSKDLDGTVRSWNPAAERIFGYTAAEMVGRPIFTIIPPELHDEERSLLARIREGEHIAHYETERLRKDGRRLRISLTLSPLRDDAGRLIGASVIKRDVTAQRALEIQLQQAQRMEAVGRLAGGIAHDFNNLLTIIGGLTTLTARRLPAGTRERRDLEQVVLAAERASALTQQLLTFSRRRLAEVEVIEPAEILRSLETLLRRVLGENVVLETAVAPDAGAVRANRVQLEQVIMNLVVNARDAMPEGGTVAIRCENAEITTRLIQERLQLKPGSYVMLAVSDTGVGMDAVTQASIFDPFYTTKEPGKGTGLGLATVYAIVQQAGGAIHVYSEVGRGSVFRVYLPRADEPVTPEAETTTAAAAGAHAPATVLLAEDDAGVRAFAAQVLTDAGYQVIQAKDGEEALELAAATGAPLELLVTDVVMPGISGRVLAERLRMIHPETGVLYMSGYTDDMLLRAGVEAEKTAFLQKPFTPERLVGTVTALVAPGPGRPGA